ncbi:uncharacterized protein ACIBXB_009046 [Morphnus guianensis]
MASCCGVPLWGPTVGSHRGVPLWGWDPGTAAGWGWWPGTIHGQQGWGDGATKATGIAGCYSWGRACCALRRTLSSPAAELSRGPSQRPELCRGGLPAGLHAPQHGSAHANQSVAQTGHLNPPSLIVTCRHAQAPAAPPPPSPASHCHVHPEGLAPAPSPAASTPLLPRDKEAAEESSPDAREWARWPAAACPGARVAGGAVRLCHVTRVGGQEPWCGCGVPGRAGCSGFWGVFLPCSSRSVAEKQSAALARPHGSWLGLTAPRCQDSPFPSPRKGKKNQHHGPGSPSRRGRGGHGQHRGPWGLLQPHRPPHPGHERWGTRAPFPRLRGPLFGLPKTRLGGNVGQPPAAPDPTGDTAAVGLGAPGRLASVPAHVSGRSPPPPPLLLLLLPPPRVQGALSIPASWLRRHVALACEPCSIFSPSSPPCAAALLQSHVRAGARPARGPAAAGTGCREPLGPGRRGRAWASVAGRVRVRGRPRSRARARGGKARLSVGFGATHGTVAARAEGLPLHRAVAWWHCHRGPATVAEGDPATRGGAAVQGCWGGDTPLCVCVRVCPPVNAALRRTMSPTCPLRVTGTCPACPQCHGPVCCGGGVCSSRGEECSVCVCVCARVRVCTGAAVWGGGVCEGVQWGCSACRVRVCLQWGLRSLTAGGGGMRVCACTCAWAPRAPPAPLAVGPCRDPTEPRWAAGRGLEGGRGGRARDPGALRAEPPRSGATGRPGPGTAGRDPRPSPPGSAPRGTSESPRGDHPTARESGAGGAGGNCPPGGVVCVCSRSFPAQTCPVPHPRGPGTPPPSRLLPAPAGATAGACAPSPV